MKAKVPVSLPVLLPGTAENYDLLNILLLAGAKHVDVRAHCSALIHIQLG